MQEIKGRILSLDLGSKTIGVAVSDPANKMALPVRTITRRALKNDLEEVLRLVKEYEVEKILIGHPLTAEGFEGIQAKKAKIFQKQVGRYLSRAAVPLPIELWDERWTTKQAEELLHETPFSRKKKKRVVDALAASFILQSYLEREEGGRKYD